MDRLKTFSNFVGASFLSTTANLFEKLLNLMLTFLLTTFLLVGYDFIKKLVRFKNFVLTLTRPKYLATLLK